MWLVLALLAVVWGTQYLVIRTTQSDLPAWLAVALRFALMAVVAQGVVTARRLYAPHGRWVERGVLGVTHALAMGLVYIAERTESSAVAACVMASTPLFIVVFAPHAGEERPTRRIVATASLGLFGVALLFAHHFEAHPHARGLALLVTAAIASAVSKTIGKRLAELPAPVLLRDLGFVVALSSAILWLIFERGEPVRWTTRNASAIVYLGVVASTAASAAWFVLLRRVPITKLSHLQFATATVGVAAGALLGGERFRLNEAVGVAAIVVAVALAARRKGVVDPSRSGVKI